VDGRSTCRMCVLYDVIIHTSAVTMLLKGERCDEFDYALQLICISLTSYVSIPTMRYSSFLNIMLLSCFF